MNTEKVVDISTISSLPPDLQRYFERALLNNNYNLFGLSPLGHIKNGDIKKWCPDEPEEVI